MPKITGVDITNITKRSGVGSFSKATGISLALGAGGGAGGYSGLTTSGIIMRLDAGDSNSYNAPGDTTWSDLSGNGNDLTLINGPTEPTAGDNYINFDGVNDRGTLTWVSGDHFYVNDTLTFGNNAPIPAFTATSVFSFPEDPANLGYIPDDSFVRFGSRRQSGGLRCLQIDFSHRGIQINLAYGTSPRISWPTSPSADFQYNSATGLYQPKPNRVLFAAVTIAPATSAQMVGYINGATYTPSSVVGDVSNVSGSTIGTVTYLSNVSVDLGPDTWNFGVPQNSDGSLGTNYLSSNVYEYVLYDRALSASEIQTNYNAYVSEYGPLN